MDLLSQRDHSEKELRQKLRLYLQRRLKWQAEGTTTHNDLTAEMIPSIVTETIDWAYQQNWMKAPEEVALQVAGALGRKRKGIQYINQYLKNKGLPPIKASAEDELEKAKDLIQSKMQSAKYAASEKVKEKLFRFLASRGFSQDIIRKALHEELQSGNQTEIY